MITRGHSWVVLSHVYTIFPILYLKRVYVITLPLKHIDKGNHFQVGTLPDINESVAREKDAMSKLKHSRISGFQCYIMALNTTMAPASITL